jgi:aldehyde dehydrogenase (NAD+)
VDRHLKHLFIGGRWTEPAGDDRIDVVDPATEKVVISVPAATTADVAAAVARSQAAIDDGTWAGAGVDARAGLIETAAEIVSGQAEEIGTIVTEEMGAPLAGTIGGHVAASVATMREMASFARLLPEREIRTSRGPDALMVRGPVGVVAALTPWNGPFATAVNKAIAALLMGNPVICKPSPQTPLDVFLLGIALAEAGLPEGLFSVLPADAEASAALVAHAGVSAISFTGSTAVGRSIGRVAGERFARVQLELGGKSAAVVLDDADPIVVAKVLRGGIFRNAGQVCTALTRVVVPRRRYDEFTEAICAEAEQIVVGDPRDTSTEMGPLALASQRERVESLVAQAIADGARVASGGRRPDGLDTGWYYTPTVIADVTNDMAIAQKEIFGPVAVVIPHDGDLDAVRIANDSPYGLHGAVFTADDQRALAVAERVQSGTFSINMCVNNPTAPFGGVKQSGIGREHDLEGLEFFSELKAVNLPPALSKSLRTTTPVFRRGDEA